MMFKITIGVVSVAAAIGYSVLYVYMMNNMLMVSL